MRAKLSQSGRNSSIVASDPRRVIRHMGCAEALGPVKLVGMIPFDPADPFPLIDEGSHTYREAQRHSALVDEWLGFEMEGIEEMLALKAHGFMPEQGFAVDGELAGQNLWIGLPVKTLLTPYTEFRALLNRLPLASGQRVCDLGAGYGRMGFVIGRHHPEIGFTGYECVRERVDEARRRLERFAYGNVEVVQADLTDPSFSPCDADYYFIYDYGSRAAIRKTLADLKAIALRRSIVVIGRGRASRDAIEQGEPWLSQVHAPEHHDHYSIYRS